MNHTYDTLQDLVYDAFSALIESRRKRKCMHGKPWYYRDDLHEYIFNKLTNIKEFAELWKSKPYESDSLTEKSDNIYDILYSFIEETKECHSINKTEMEKFVSWFQCVDKEIESCMFIIDADNIEHQHNELYNHYELERMAF